MFFCNSGIHGVKARDLMEGLSRQEQLKNRAARGLTENPWRKEERQEEAEEPGGCQRLRNRAEGGRGKETRQWRPWVWAWEGEAEWREGEDGYRGRKCEALVSVGGCMQRKLHEIASVQ